MGPVGGCSPARTAGERATSEATSEALSEAKRIGSLWKPRPDAKHLGSGIVTVDGMKQRFIIVKNDWKDGERDPDYRLLSYDPPEPDTYQPKPKQEAERDPSERDELPF